MYHGYEYSWKTLYRLCAEIWPSPSSFFVTFFQLATTAKSFVGKIVASHMYKPASKIKATVKLVKPTENYAKLQGDYGLSDVSSLNGSFGQPFCLRGGNHILIGNCVFFHPTPTALPAKGGTLHGWGRPSIDAARRFDEENLGRVAEAALNGWCGAMPDSTTTSTLLIAPAA